MLSRQLDVGVSGLGERIALEENFGSRQLEMVFKALRLDDR